jgi:hypothetical protein
MALVEPDDQAYRHIGAPLAMCVVPLVAVGTRADERSIWGTVVDANEHPVAGAIIQCNSVAVRGSGGLRAFFPGSYLSSKCAKAVADKDGRFSMHLPLPKQDGTLGRPVPPGSDTIAVRRPEDSAGL